MKVEDTTRTYSIADAAWFTGLPVKQIQKALITGEIPSREFAFTNDMPVIDSDDLDKYLVKRLRKG